LISLSRRDALRHGVAAPVTLLVNPFNVAASTPKAAESQPSISSDTISQCIERQLSGDVVNWPIAEVLPATGALRYAPSTLRVPPQAPQTTAVSPVEFPSWMEGTWEVTATFKGAKFPGGKALKPWKGDDLRIAGVGLATCLVLPNVGSSPRPYLQRFLRGTGSDLRGGSKSSSVFLDRAFSAPETLEAFWPEAKVSSVRNIAQLPNAVSSASGGGVVSCYSSGKGCTSVENPSLHSPSMRYGLTFVAPTSRGGLAEQSVDVTLVAASSQATSPVALASAPGGDGNGGSFFASQSYVQYNIEQNLQTAYTELLRLSPSVSREDSPVVRGSLRVAAFKAGPPNADDISTGTAQNDRAAAVAFFDYEIVLSRAQQEEGAEN